eukprot:TRINITY_DN8597_c0_g1_i1.p1 TRINITY_DN8597_c0_g1~~TRINITY_DN8597_c0_g1_i1.p1  ORF type:complete len:859 (+),score=191.53 TRINITY_DN8597_c0_g1_i1:129-2705(+)
MSGLEGHRSDGSGNGDEDAQEIAQGIEELCGSPPRARLGAGRSSRSARSPIQVTEPFPGSAMGDDSLGPADPSPRDSADGGAAAAAAVQEGGQHISGGSGAAPDSAKSLGMSMSSSAAGLSLVRLVAEAARIRNSPGCGSAVAEAGQAALGSPGMMSGSAEPGSGRAVQQPSMPPYDRNSRYEVGKNLLVNDSRVLLLHAGGEISMRRASGGGWCGAGHNALRLLIQGNAGLHDPTAPSMSGGGPADFTFPLSESAPGVSPTKRIRYDLKEFEPLMDSAGCDMSDWVRLAEEIMEQYQRYDGIVILHGTDTMPYTASALSFMLEQLGKTVVLTGCQVPMCEPRSDAVANLVDAIHIAGTYVIPEVVVCFARRLLRGSRVVKTDAEGFDVFQSPNSPQLGSCGTRVRINWKHIRKPSSESAMKLRTKVCPQVSVIHLFPGITDSTVRAALAPPTRGAVLRLYGQGNAPLTRHDLLGIIRAAVQEQDVVVVSTSQASVGGTLAETETGQELSRIGVTIGNDMTLECAIAKLAFLLGEEASTSRVRAMLSTSLRGELTVPVAEKLCAQNDQLLTALSRPSTVGPVSIEIAAAEETELDDLRSYLHSVVMCSAALNGDLSSLQRLIHNANSHPPDPHSPGQYKSGWRVDSQDHSSKTPLHIAAAAGHAEICRVLLAAGASVHLKDNSGHTPLLEALLHGHQDTAEVIATAGGTIGLDDVTLAQHLNQAVYTGALGKLRLFLAFGANPCVTDYARCSPLNLAVQRGNLEMVKELLATERCDLQQRDWWGWTPLDVAREGQSRSTQPQCYVFEAIADLLANHTEAGGTAPETDAGVPSPEQKRPTGQPPGAISDALAVGDTIDT